MKEACRSPWMRAESTLGGAALALAFITGCASSTPTRTPVPTEAECYTLAVDEPDALFMLGHHSPDTLILSPIVLESPFAAPPIGYRAFLRASEWLSPPPLQPTSWRWRPLGPDSIRIGFVLPVWGIVWSAARTADGLYGEVRYTSDDVDDRPRSSSFTARRFTCPSRST